MSSAAAAAALGERLVAAALASAQPAPALAAALSLRAVDGRPAAPLELAVRGRAVAMVAPGGCVVLLGAGKAAVAMAAEAARILRAAGLTTRGLVVTKNGHASDDARLELARAGVGVVEAAHPTPDAAGEAAAAALLREAAAVPPGGLALLLLSGGGSALTPLPPPGVTLAELQRVNACLLACGAPIGDVNCVRKHVSAFSGGRLGAALAHAQLVTLALSDVAGDAPDVIASGPSVPDPTTFADALGVLRRHGLLPQPAAAAAAAAAAAGAGAAAAAALPEAVLAHLAAGAEGRIPESPKTSPAGHSFHVVGSSVLALAAVADAARAHGLAPVVVSATLQGEAAEVGRALAQLAWTGGSSGSSSSSSVGGVRAAVRALHDAGYLASCARRFEGDCDAAADAAREAARAGARAPPLCLILGGEPTVTLGGGGAPLPAGCAGGRNQHLALAAALELQDLAAAAAAAVGAGAAAGERAEAEEGAWETPPWVLSLGTDGSDGPTPAAGAAVGPATVACAAAHGLDARAQLRAFDSHTFFARLERALLLEAAAAGGGGAAAERSDGCVVRLGGLLTTGPTGTNVADVVVVVCGQRRRRDGDTLPT